MREASKELERADLKGFLDYLDSLDPLTLNDIVVPPRMEQSGSSGHDSAISIETSGRSP